MSKSYWPAFVGARNANHPFSSRVSTGGPEGEAFPISGERSGRPRTFALVRMARVIGTTSMAKVMRIIIASRNPASLLGGAGGSPPADGRRVDGWIDLSSPMRSFGDHRQTK